MAPNTLNIAEDDGISITGAALLTGYHLCGVGVAGILIVPTARVWGKRHLFLMGHVLMIVSCVWAGASGTNATSLLWARIFQGVALAPFEALVNACVGDLYFLHERGKRMAVSNVALFGAAFLTPVLVGKITATLTWKWSFYFVAIFLAAALPLMFFFVPETAYRRADYLNTDFKHKNRSRNGSPEAEQPLSRESNGEEPKEHSMELNGTSSTQVTAQQPVLEKDSFVKTLRPFNGRKTDENFFKLLLRPFPLFFHPSIFWVSSSVPAWDEHQILTVTAGVLDPRCHHRLGRLSGCHPGHRLPDAASVVYRSPNGIYVHRCLHRLHGGSGVVRPAQRLDEQSNDPPQPRPIRARVPHLAGYLPAHLLRHRAVRVRLHGG